MDNGPNIGFRCKCGKRWCLRDFLSESEQDFWLPKVPLRKQFGCLWLLCQGKGIEEAAAAAEIDLGSSGMDIYRRFVDTVSHFMQIENDACQIGGEGVQCEADEVALRCVAGTNEEGEAGVWWLRYFGLARRGSSRMLLYILPDRFAKAAGQGGGGALTVAELKEVLRIGSEKPALLPKSILHTDSAKAYKRVGPMRWSQRGALHEKFEDGSDFAELKYTHTNVTHKKKPGQPVKYVEQFTVELPDGTSKEVLGGTEKVDGFWATLRRLIGRKGVNTGARDKTAKRDWFHKNVRVAQWLYWFADDDRFKRFASYVQQSREGNDYF